VKPRVSLLTLGVSDLERAVAFYRDGLGWPKSEVGGDEVAFFKTGSDLALFPRVSFAASYRSWWSSTPALAGPPPGA
jgi:catechol 2,3-dioxygenase-like lactoylglutathione lyase family enzyme